MAATGNEVPLLSQLKLLKNWIATQISKKLDDPIDTASDGPNDGDILMYQAIVGSTTPTHTYWSSPRLLPKATVSADGLMSSEDKTKLDSLSPSAVDIVKTTSHKTTYTKDTLEVVVDSTDKVTSMYFISV